LNRNEPQLRDIIRD
jgi:hypothetical protein